MIEDIEITSIEVTRFLIEVDLVATSDIAAINLTVNMGARGPPGPQGSPGPPGIVSASAPLLLVGGNLSIDLSGYQPIDADLTSLSSASASDTLYYRSAPGVWSVVTIGTGLSFTGGVLSATGGGGGVPPGSMDFSALSQSGLVALLEDI